MLSIRKYSALCVVGMEIFYVLCLPYGYLLSANGKELHDAIFELIPGFVWGNPMSMLWGAMYLGVSAWIVGWYIACMHNASLIPSTK